MNRRRCWAMGVTHVKRKTTTVTDAILAISSGLFVYRPVGSISYNIYNSFRFFLVQNVDMLETHKMLLALSSVAYSNDCLLARIIVTNVRYFLIFHFVIFGVFVVVIKGHFHFVDSIRYWKASRVREEKNNIKIVKICCVKWHHLLSVATHLNFLTTATSLKNSYRGQNIATKQILTRDMYLTLCQLWTWLRYGIDDDGGGFVWFSVWISYETGILDVVSP